MLPSRNGLTSSRSLRTAEDKVLFSGKKNEQASSEEYRTQTKIEIVNRLLDINGSMKEFSEGIEAKIYQAFTSRAGHRYSTGMSSPKERISFDSSKRRSVEGRMKDFLMQIKGVRKL